MFERENNPSGWVFVQRIFATSFTSVVQIYAENQSLPDYLIVVHDDTHVSIGKIVKMMIQEPIDFKTNGTNQTMAIYPSPGTPIVLAGCRAQAPNHLLTWTIPFEGYGTFFRKRSIIRMLQPLHCDVKHWILKEEYVVNC